jgi:hypothetical protein
MAYVATPSSGAVCGKCRQSLIEMPACPTASASDAIDVLTSSSVAPLNRTGRGVRHGEGGNSRLRPD